MERRPPSEVDPPTLPIPVRSEIELVCDTTADLPSRPPAPELTASLPDTDTDGDSPAGQQIGRYRLAEEIGRGGMGVVYLAFDRDLRRKVAMKVINQSLATHPELYSRFVEEAQTTAQLQHPGIVPVYEIGQDDGRLFFTMKLIKGQTLADIVAAQRQGDPAVQEEYTPYRLLQIVTEVARTVSFAHERGVLHRDLKPGNVMVGPYGEVQVLDWGLAKVVDALEVPVEQLSESDVVTDRRREGTHVGRLLGTPSYMSPEQARGDPGAIGRPSDVYALGAMLYHVLTGTPPYLGRTVRVVRDKILSLPPVPPRKLDPSIPRPVEAICLRAMAKNPEHRYPSARALADDLQAHLEGRPVAAYPESLFARAAKAALRHRRLTLTVGIGLLLGFIGSLVALYLIDQERSEAERQRKIADGARQAAEQRTTEAWQLGSAILEPLTLTEEAASRTEVLYSAAAAVNSFFEGLADDPAPVESLRLRALGHAAMGDVLRDQGRLEEARTAYQQALKLFEGRRTAGSAEALGDLLAINYRLGELLKELGEFSAGQDRFQQNLEIAQALTELGFPVVGHTEAARTRLRIGLLLEQEGRTEASLAAVAQGLASARRVLEQAGSEEDALKLSVFYLRLGGLHKQLGNLEQAQQFLEQALSLDEAAAAADPENPHRQRDLAHACQKLAGVLSLQGASEAALTSCRRAVTIYQRLCALDPFNARLQASLSGAYGLLSVELISQGHIEEGEAAARAALAIDRQLVERDPANTRWQAALAGSYLALGEILREQGDPEAAEHLHRALDTVNRLIDKNPDNFAWVKLQVASQLGVVTLKKRAGDVEGARKMLAQTLEAGADRAPDNAFWQFYRAVMWLEHGYLAERQQDWAAAAASYRQVLALARRLPELDPVNARWYLVDEMQAHEAIGHLLDQQGKRDAALAAYREALRVAERLDSLPEPPAGLPGGPALDGTSDDALPEVLREASVVPRLLQVEDRPLEVRFKDKLLAVHSAIGEILEIQGASQEARAAFAEALRLAEELAELDPDGASWSDSAAVARFSLRFSDAVLGNPADFIATLRHLVERDGTPQPAIWLSALSGEREPLAPYLAGTAWTARLARYLVGRTAASELLAAAAAPDDETDRQKRLCEAHLFIAIEAERSGDRPAAIRHYQRCLETERTEYLEYRWARGRLRVLAGAGGR